MWRATMLHYWREKMRAICEDKRWQTHIDWSLQHKQCFLLLHLNVGISHEESCSAKSCSAKPATNIFVPHITAIIKKYILLFYIRYLLSCFFLY